MQTGVGSGGAGSEPAVRRLLSDTDSNCCRGGGTALITDRSRCMIRSGAERCCIFRPGQTGERWFLMTEPPRWRSQRFCPSTTPRRVLREVDGVSLLANGICRLARERMVAVGGGQCPQAGMANVCIYDAATFERWQAIAYDCPNSVAFSPDGADDSGRWLRQEGVGFTKSRRVRL